MAEHDARRIAHEATSEPHVRGRGISVRQVDALVEAGGVDRETVADRDDLDVAGVYHALAHYHDHPREMSTVETERADTFESIRESIDRPDGWIRTQSEMDERAFLREENVDPKTASYLDRADVHAEHVRDAVGRGADDSEDLSSARAHDLVVTSDVSDFGAPPTDAHAGLVRLYDDTLPAYRVASAVITMVDAYPERADSPGRETLDPWA